jgi:phosphate transport system substrate-binding protein
LLKPSARLSGKTPVVESTGTGGGMKLFCAGVGEANPDFTNASRAIKKSEFEECVKNGVTDIVEIKVGFDGLTASPSRKKRRCCPDQDPDVPRSRQGNSRAPMASSSPTHTRCGTKSTPALPATKIEVLGPPPTSGTRDSFAELVMEKGAEGIESLAASSRRKTPRL